MIFGATITTIMKIERETTMYASDLLTNIAACGYDCEAGPLQLNVKWNELCALLNKTSPFLPGELVWYRVKYTPTSEKPGFVSLDPVYVWAKFTIVAVIKNAAGWRYTISRDPPSEYHYGSAGVGDIHPKDIHREKPED
jgi:hypothetical protein